MDRVEKTIILVTIFGLLLICGLAFFMVGCSDVPYSRPLVSIDDVLRTADDDTICLDDGFDAVCVKAIPGQDGKDGLDGKDGRDGKDGQDGKDGKDGKTLIAIHERPVPYVVERIIKEIVEVPTIEYRDRIVIEYRDRIVEKVVTEFVDREVPVKVFVNRVVEIIKEVIVEKEVIKEVPVPQIVEVIKTVFVAAEEEPISVTEGETYTEANYHNPPAGHHAHRFTHTHDGAEHTHEFVHPNGQADNWKHEHDGYGGLGHD